MSDVAFRQAVATVINKELLADTVLAGTVFPDCTIVHPDLTLHYNEEVARPGWVDGEPMDQGARFEEVIRILEEAGYTWESEPVVVRVTKASSPRSIPKAKG
jgi:peptide/nickel transport system substrate-binding protein